MEQLETTQQGAAREAKEEACADVDIGPLLAIYNVERISQVQIFYRGDLRSPDIAAGDETVEVALLDWEEIPWAELAFPSVYWALKYFHETRDMENFPPAPQPEDWLATPGFKYTG
jgi:ADP-ribose pyrophosphatase YjhB (NUDIX family)